jgi:glutamine synthetase
VLTEQTVAAFENYDVLSKRELESRYEVWVEQYAIRANIEAETTHSIAKTMLLPAALRYLALIADSGAANSVADEVKRHLEALGTSLKALEAANAPNELEGMDLALHARDKQIAAMADVRDAADKLEKVVADDLWPLPKNEEMIFIK